MNRPSLLLTFLLASLVALTSCSGGKAGTASGSGDTLRLKYSSLLTIVRHDGYTDVTVSNPWKPGRVLHRYRLVPQEAAVPRQDDGVTIVRTPIRRASVFTTVHCSLLTQFGVGESIVGVADLKYIKIPYIHERVRMGYIADCGNGMNPVVEKIIDQKPDAILLSPFENSGGYGKVEQLGVPLIECAEYMETSPLARAEWMRFYGLLFGREQMADSLFHVVDSSYQALKQVAAQAKSRPKVLIDKMVGSVWYVPGGRSTIGQMVADAGGYYPWGDDAHGGSLPLPFETVLEHSGDADIWLYRYSSDTQMTLAQLRDEHRGYVQLKAFNSGHVYGCNVEQSLFYEQTPFRPDWLLSDFIQIFHSDITNLPAPRYYRKME